MYDETGNLLTQEFSDITLVNNIIEQIASGSNTINVIANKIGEKEPTILYSIEKLITVGLVEKKKSLIHSFMGQVFEDMCKYYTLKQGIKGEFDCFITTVGSWWGNETILNDNGEKVVQSADIDVVALSEIEKKQQ